MKEASTGFVEALNQPIRPTTQCRVVIGEPLSDRINGTRDGWISYTTDVVGTTAEYEYITLEKDFFVVGGSQIIKPASETTTVKSNGFVSENVATKATSTAGEYTFATVPSLTIAFMSKVLIGRLSFIFNEGLSGITMTGMLDSNTVYTHSFDVSEGTTVSYKWSDKAAITKLVITFPTMRNNVNRLRVKSIMVEGYELNNDDIISLNHSLTVDPLSLDLPSNHLTVKVANYDHWYDPDNTNNVWSTFARKQSVKLYYGTEVNGQTEWLEPDILYLEDAPAVDSNAATFDAYDILYFLTDTFLEGEYSTGDITIKKVIKQILITNCGIQESGFDLGTSSLMDSGLYAPMSLAACRDCLQLLANASCTTLMVSRNGVIKFLNKDFDESADANLVDYYLDYDKMMEKPTVKIGTLLKDVQITTHTMADKSYSTSEEPITAYEGELKTITGSTVVNATYSQAIWPTEVTVSPSGGTDVKLDSDWTYARAATVIVVPTGTSGLMQVKVMGYKLYDWSETDTWQCNDSGESCKIDNPMIGGDERNAQLAERVKSWYKHRYLYDVEFRQDFRLELMDKIQLQTQFGTKVPAIITGLTFTLPGQTGTINLRRMD